MNSFLPPVVFEIYAKTDKALVEFKKINAELAKMEKNGDKSAAGMVKMQRASYAAKAAVVALAGAFATLAVVSVKAAMEEQQALAGLQVAVNNTGQSFAAAMPFIDKTAQALIQLGFADDDTYNALRKLTTATGDVKVAMKSMGAAADLARYYHMGLGDAADLLAKASTGQAKGLRDIGIAMGVTIDKGATYADILQMIQDKVGGAAEAFSNTAAGKMAIFAAQVDDLKEKIGYELLPTFIKLVDWINKRAIPAFKTFFQFLADNKIIILGIAGAIAAVWTITKINTAVMATVAAIRIVIGAYNMLKVSAAAAYVAEMLALNPLLGVAAAATLGLIMAKAVEWAKKTNQEVKDPEGLVNTDWGAMGDGITNKVVKPLTAAQKALVDAKQAAIDFRVEMVKTATEIYGKWKDLIGRDTKDAIRFALLDPVDQLVEKSKTLMSSYTAASNKFAAANAQLSAAERAYQKAVQGTNEALKASTKSALDRARAVMTSVQGDISKALDNLKQLQDDVIAAIADAYKKIEELKAERAKIIADANEEEARVTKQHLKDLMALRKDYDKSVAEAQADAVKKSAEIVKQSVDQLRGIYRSATDKSIGDIFSSLTYGGKYSKGGSTTKMITALGLQLDKAKTLADDAARLGGLGFTQTFIEQVVAQGPDVGHQLAQTIINSTPEQVRELQSMWNQLDAQSQHGVDALATTLNSGMKLATEELTAALKQVSTDLATTLKNLMAEFTAAEADMIASFNETIAGIRTARDKAVAGIDAQIQVQQDNITKLEEVLKDIENVQPPSTNAIVPFIPTEDLPPTTNLPYTTSTPSKTTVAKAPASKYVVKPGDTLSAIAKANDMTLKELYAANPKFKTDPKYQGGNMIWSGTTVNITASTNASAQSIANDVGWAIRTSGDVSYGSGVNTTTLAGINAASSTSTSSGLTSAQIVAARKAEFGYL